MSIVLNISSYSLYIKTMLSIYILNVDLINYLESILANQLPLNRGWYFKI